MSYVDQVKQCKRSQDAVLVLAQAADDIMAALGALGTPASGDEWGDWGGIPSVDDGPAVHATPPSTTGNKFDPVRLEVDPEEVARCQAKYDEAAELFEKGRRSGLPKDQLAGLAQQRDGWAGRLRLAKDPGTIMDLDTPGDPHYVEVLGAGDDVTYDIPPVTQEKQNRRYEWAAKAQLHQYFPPHIADDDAQVEELRLGYAKGGPMWLYIGNPELVYSMPLEHRKDMAKDLAEENPRVAYEFARDVCKAEDEGDTEGASEWIHALTDAGGTPFKGRD